MQPHAPFRDAPSLFDEFVGTDDWGSRIWRRIDSDELDRERFFEAYRDNLRWVLEDGVNQIKQNCSAKIALTADHGNAAGEYGYYGHPKHSPVSSVRVVPWTVVEGIDKEIKKTDSNTGQQTVDIDKQFEVLGYR
jgi:hypothetical protein